MPYKNFNVNTNTQVDKTNFTKFDRTFRTKCKALSLRETKYFWKDNLRQAVAVSRELQCSIGKGKKEMETSCFP